MLADIGDHSQTGCRHTVLHTVNMVGGLRKNGKKNTQKRNKKSTDVTPLELESSDAPESNANMALMDGGEGDPHSEHMHVQQVRRPTCLSCRDRSVKYHV